MSDVVLSEQRGSICVLTLNRPERLNAINSDMVTAFCQALVKANADDDTRVIVLKGAGRAFCTGNDLKDSAKDLGVDMDTARAELHGRELQEITRQIVNSDKIVIGAVHGWAVGAGFEWVINCDFSVWAEDARAFFPEVSWGLFTTGGVMTLLSRMVGIIKAREMLLMGDKYDAQQLLELGVAWRVVPGASLMETVFATAEHIAGLPAIAVRCFKKTFNEAMFMNLEQTLDAEVKCLVATATDPETAGRVSKFEKK